MTGPFDPLQSARAALSKASLADPRVRRPDPLVLVQWTEILADTTPAEAMAAVKWFYRQPRERTIGPGDVRAHALESRRSLRPLSKVVGELQAIAEHPGDPAAIEAAKAHIRDLLANRKTRKDAAV